MRLHPPKRQPSRCLSRFSPPYSWSSARAGCCALHAARLGFYTDNSVLSATVHTNGIEPNFGSLYSHVCRKSVRSQAMLSQVHLASWGSDSKRLPTSSNNRMGIGVNKGGPKQFRWFYSEKVFHKRTASSPPPSRTHLKRYQTHPRHPAEQLHAARQTSHVTRHT